MGVLTVVLKRINHLQDDDTLGKSDPYVKFHLEHDNWLVDKNMGKHQSTKKKNQINPVYNETFKFEDISKLDNLKLYVKSK
jgi:Ca2+-dependent lipid-binding protein